MFLVTYALTCASVMICNYRFIYRSHIPYSKPETYFITHTKNVILNMIHTAYVIGIVTVTKESQHRVWPLV